MDHGIHSGKFGRLVRNPYLQFIAFGAAVSLLPLLVKGSTLVILGTIVIYSIVAIGFNLLLGYSGQMSLGTAGFMGLASYITVYCMQDLQLPTMVAIILAVAFPILVGIVVGALALRISGALLAIATLCFSEIMRKSYESLGDFTGGFSGRTLSAVVLFGIKLDRNGTFIVLVAALVLVMMLTHNLVNSQLGRAFHAIRGSEHAAQAMGVKLMKYRLISFALASAYAALAGSLYMLFAKFSYPSIWTMAISLFILAAVIIGGIRSTWGTILGVLIVFGISDLVLKKLPVISDINGLAYILNGVLIAVVVIFLPQGLSQLVRSLSHKAWRGLQKLTAKRRGTDGE